MPEYLFSRCICELGGCSELSAASRYNIRPLGALLPVQMETRGGDRNLSRLSDDG